MVTPQAMGALLVSSEPSTEWWWQDHPPPQVQKYLFVAFPRDSTFAADSRAPISLDVSLAHRGRPGLHLHIGRFYETLNRPTMQQQGPSPCLLNAMYLLGCHFSFDALLGSLETHYLTRSRLQLSAELSKPAPNLVHWIQASCLVSYYLLRTGRFLEARQEVCTASEPVSPPG